MSASPKPLSLLVGAKRGELTRKLLELLKEIGGEKILWVERGPEVIERVLEQNFDGIILDASLSLIDPLELREILRHNPRTLNTPILLLDLYEQSPKGSETQGYIRSPLERKEWLSLLLPAHAALDEILRVSLKDLPLLDLIQMLLQSTQSGVLEIQHLTEFGRIEIAPPALGEITWNGKFFGIKALSRCLRLSEGSVSFRKRSGIEPRYFDPGKILLEAVKDRDEYLKFRPAFPPNSTLRLVRQQELPPVPDSFLQELLMILEVESRVDMILDQLPRADGEILYLLHELKGKGWVEVETRREGEPFEGFASEPPALPVLPGMYLTLWVLGEEGRVSDALFRDYRLVRRLNFQATLVNEGRLGGNHWVLRFPGDVHIWLRFLSPRLAHPEWMNRRGWINAGAILLFSDQEEDVESFDRIAHLLNDSHIPLVWVLWAEREKEMLWSEIFGEELPGKVIQCTDPVEGFLKAMNFLLYQQTMPD